MWELMLAAGGQMRLAPDGRPYSIDAAAVFAMGRAQGVPAAVIGTFLPALERVVIRAIHDMSKGEGRANG